MFNKPLLREIYKDQLLISYKRGGYHSKMYHESQAMKKGIDTLVSHAGLSTPLANLYHISDENQGESGLVFLKLLK